MEQNLILHSRNTPFEFPLGQRRVIMGWDEGIGLLNIGSRQNCLFHILDMALEELEVLFLLMLH